MQVEPASTQYVEEWLALRCALWPDELEESLREDIAAMLEAPDGDEAAWLALEATEVIGFAEAALRHDYVNGCETSPVAFLEGIFVVPAARGRGVGRALSEAVAAWGRSRGAREYASDALLDNLESHAFHAALGFEEAERVVYFRRALAT
jgi:aminoglycoside 6'-N-acetyltransferase I